MLPVQRKASFILSATHHGTLIVSRMDWRRELDNPDAVTGVGIELLETGAYQPGEIDCAVGILVLRRQYYGDGVVAIDGGANIGVHTVEWAKTMAGWGQVVAIEPQERIFYALAGNIALNNCSNACAMNAALGNELGFITVPRPDYDQPGNFGGLSLINMSSTGQDLAGGDPVRLLMIDKLGLDRLDLLKLDIEGMEMEAIEGAKQTIETYTPVLMIEHIIVDNDAVHAFLKELGYEGFYFGQNIIAAHRLDKCLDHIRELHRLLLREKIEDAA